MKPLVIAVSLVLVILPWLILIPLLVNRAVAEYRAMRREGREMDPADRDFVRLCYVTLLVALWLGGW